VNAPFRHELFDIAVAQAEAKLEPDAAANDLRRESMALVHLYAMRVSQLFLTGMLTMLYWARFLTLFNRRSMLMGRKVVGFSVPAALAEEVEELAKQERRTKSELFREMLRVYQLFRKQRMQEEERWVTDLIREAKEEREKHPMTEEEMLRESEELARYGA
jgi:phenylpropionate dioxygenase-like ring-hydroxylating dioxygenase large terminal subunit